jgi:hypothetical protein
MQPALPPKLIEKQLILNVIRLQRTELLDQSLLSLLQEKLDWEFIIATTLSNQVINLLYFQLHLPLFISHVPEEIISRLRQWNLAILSKNIIQTEQFQKIFHQFKEHTIELIILKGPILAELVYPKPELRTYSDLDILIRLTDLTKAKQILLNNGYQLYEGVYPESFYLKYHYHLSFYKWVGDVVCIIEIHWHILPSSFPIQLDIEMLWSSALQTKLYGITAFHLSWEHFLLHLSTSFILDNHLTLKTCCDITEVIQKHQDTINLGNLLPIADQHNCRKMLYYALFCSQKYCGLALPLEINTRYPWNEFQDRWLKQHAEASYFPTNLPQKGRWHTSKEYLLYWFRYLLLTDTKGYRFQFFKQLLFPDEYFLHSFYRMRVDRIFLLQRIRYMLKGIKNVFIILFLYFRLRFLSKKPVS